MASTGELAHLSTGQRSLVTMETRLLIQTIIRPVPSHKKSFPTNIFLEIMLDIISEMVMVELVIQSRFVFIHTLGIRYSHTEARYAK